MRILCILHQFFPQYYTGTERFTLDLCKQIRRMGSQMDVLTYTFYTKGLDETHYLEYDYSKNGFLIKEYEYEGVPVTSIRHESKPEDLNFAISMNEMASFLQETLFEYDLIHVLHPARVGGTAIKVAKRLKIPTILTLTDFWVICPKSQLLTNDRQLCLGTTDLFKCVRDCYGEEYRDKLTRRFKEMKELVHAVDYIVAPTYFLASVVKNILNVNISVIPYGIDYEFIKKVQKKSDGSLTLGFIGTVLAHKGVHVLIKAVKLLKETIKLKIHGSYFHEIAYYYHLKEFAGEDERIEFLGEYDYSDISKILSGIDAVVVPSIWWENSPFTILTSYAYKTPVIASNLGGMSEIVKDGMNGFLFEMGNPKSLAEVIRRILKNLNMLKRIETNIVRPPRIEEIAFEYDKTYRFVHDKKHGSKTLS